MGFDLSGDDFIDELIQWEDLIGSYDKLQEVGDEMPDKIKHAVLLMRTPKQLKEHLMVNASRITKYTDMKTIIEGFFDACRPMMTNGVMPMDIGACYSKGKARVRKVTKGARTTRRARARSKGNQIR